MVHRGEVVEKAVRQSGYSITKLANRMGKSRRHVYNIFENPNVPIDTILEIGKIIHYNFSELFPAAYDIQDSKENISEHRVGYPHEEETVDYWRNKYILLLEKYNDLLEQKGGKRKQ